MITRLADKVAFLCVRYKFISQKDKELYQLGFDVLLSTMLQVLIILMVGILLNNLKGAILYLLIMQSIRCSSGGYHARTRIGCLSAMIVAYLFCRYVPVYIIEYQIQLPFLLVVMIGSNMVFFLWAPIKNDRKVLKENWYKEARKKAIIFLNFWLDVAFIMYFRRLFYAVQILTIILVISWLIIICKIERRPCDEE